MARSFWYSSHATKVAKMAPKPTRSPMTTLLFQGCVWPPYCSARIYEQIRPIIRAAPARSICRNFSLSVASTGAASPGALNRKKMITAATTPMGRLM